MNQGTPVSLHGHPFHCPPNFLTLSRVLTVSQARAGSATMMPAPPTTEHLNAHPLTVGGTSGEVVRYPPSSSHLPSKTPPVAVDGAPRRGSEIPTHLPGAQRQYLSGPRRIPWLLTFHSLSLAAPFVRPPPRHWAAHSPLPSSL